MIHYTCIFNQSPVGLPNVLMENPPSDFQAPSTALAAYLQNMIWEVVTAYPRTGVTDSSTGAYDSELGSNSIDVFPNPVTDILFISEKYSKNNTEKLLYNSNGKIIYHGTDSEINVGHLPIGIYFLNIGDFNAKIIKQ